MNDLIKLQQAQIQSLQKKVEELEEKLNKANVIFKEIIEDYDKR